MYACVFMYIAFKFSTTFRKHFIYLFIHLFIYLFIYLFASFILFEMSLGFVSSGQYVQESAG